MNSLRKREFLAGGLSVALSCGIANIAGAQAPMNAMGMPRTREIPHRLAKTTPLFKCPSGFPNALAIMTDPPGGLWIGEQKLSGYLAAMYHLPEPTDLNERAWLVDWKGNVLKTVVTPQSKNTGGIAYGDGCIWRCTEFDGANGVYQTDMNSRLVSHRQIPLGPSNDGGGAHGAKWVDGKLWIVANRLRGVLRIGPETWTPEFLIPEPTNIVRFHDIAWDNGTIWQVTGNDSDSYADGKSGLVRLDAATGDVMEIVEFVSGSCDPHGLAIHEGVLIGCDAGIHPRWPNYASPYSGYVFRIDLI